MSKTSSNSFMSYEEAKEHIAKHDIKNLSEYSYHRKTHIEGFRLPGDTRYWPEYEGSNIFFNKKVPEYWSYGVAQSYVQKNSIETLLDYREHREIKKIKFFLPCAPNVTYKNSGWTDTYTFFGTDPERHKKGRNFLKYFDAKELIHSERIENRRQYLDYLVKHSLKEVLPSDPVSYYKKYGCKGADDFFVKTRFMSYRDAKILIQKNGVKTFSEYRKFRQEKKLMKTLPSDLYYVYRDEYEGSNIFFKTFLTYQEAKQYLQDKGIDNYNDYRKHAIEVRGKVNLPVAPAQVYKNNGWVDSDEFFGKKVHYATFYQAKRYVQEKGVDTHEEYRALIIKAQDSIILPKYPRKYYSGDGWIDASDFYGKKRNYLSYIDARALVLELGIKDYEQYLLILESDDKKLSKLPENPQRHYEHTGWVNFYDFFGNTIPDSFSYLECKKYLADESIYGVDQYKAHRLKTNLKELLPEHPEKYFYNEWEGSDIFFNRKAVLDYVSYEQAQEFARRNDFSSLGQYREFIDYKNLSQYPPNPEKIYKKCGWINTRTFLKVPLIDFVNAKKYLKDHAITSTMVRPGIVGDLIS